MNPLSEIPDDVVVRAADLGVVIRLAADDAEYAEVYPGNNHPFVLRAPAEGRLYDIGLPPMPLAGIIDALECRERHLAGNPNAWRKFGKGWLWFDA